MKLIIFRILAVFAALPFAAFGSLIQNGSFESPGFGAGNGGPGRQQYVSPSVGISDWTLSGSGDVFLHKTPEIGTATNPTFNSAQNGSYYLDLSGGGTAHAMIFQDIPTVPSKTYHLSFYIGAANFTPPAATVNVQISGNATHLDTTLTPLAPATNINWLFKTFSFVADSTTTRVSFQDVSATDDNASFVDSVVLVSDPPTITSEPQSVNVAPGDAASFSVTADGAGTLTYQWQKDGMDINGATEPSFPVASVKPADIGNYKVRITDLSGNIVESQEVSLTVTGVDSSIWQGLIAYYPFDASADDATVFGFDGISMGATAAADRRGIAAKAYRLNGSSFVDFPQFPTLGGPSSQFTISLWTKAESVGPIFGDYDGTQTGGDEIFAAHIALDNNPVHSALPNYLSTTTRNYPTLPRDHTLYIGTSTIIGSGWRHIVYQMDGVGSCYTFVDGVKVGTRPYNPALNHVQAPHWRAGKLLFVGQNQFFTGSVDDIRIYNRALSEAEVQALYTSEANATVRFSEQPQNQTTQVGGSVNFSVQATGIGPLSYQWQKDGIDLLGETNDALQLSNVSALQIGSYRCRVSDASTTVVSDGAALSIVGVDSSIWQGLIAYYPFEASAEDATVFGFDGVSVGALPAADRRGIAAAAYRLNGSSFVDFPQFPTLGEPSSQFTISLWTKAESVGPIFGDYDGTQTAGDGVFAAHIAVDNNPALSALPNYLSIATRNNPTLPLGYTQYFGTSAFIGSGWRHIVYQMDGVGSCHTFLDGVKVGTRPYNPALNHVQLPHWRAGKTLFVGQNQFFTGSVDDIRIYNRALSEAEVQALYTSEANHPPVAVDDGPLELPLVDFAVIGNDSDPDGSPISVTAVSTASGGTASRKSNGLVSYVPGAAFTGTDTFTYTLTDGGGLTSVGTVTVRDTTPPSISIPFTVRTTGAATMPDFTARAVGADTVGVASVTQSPAPGSTFPLGSSTVTLTARDLAGNEASASFTIIHHPPQPAHTAITKSGDPVPGAGTINGLPAGAVFTDVGVPAINDAGDVAFIAKWASTAGPGVGVFAGSPPLLLVKEGDPSPSPDGGVFKTFTDPVLNAAGKVALFATLKGSGIRTTNNTVLITNALGGGLEVVAREGGDTSGVDGAKIRTFKDLSLVAGEVLFTATLTGGTPAVRSANDAAAFRATSGGIEKVVREGDSLNGSIVKAFLLLEVAAGSPGQNRAHRSGQATFLALLADGTQAVAQNASGVVSAVVSSGESPGGSLAITSFRSFGLPSANPDEVAFVGNLNVGVGVTKGDAKGVFVGDGTSWQPIARLEKPVPGITGANFKSFLDPVLAQGSESIAFQASFKGKGIGSTADAAIFYRPAGGGLNMVARESATPPGGASALRWKNFVSLALPDGNTGPLFHATLSGSGVNAGNDAGVWAMDSDGDIRLLFREGDIIDGKKLKSFTVLNAIPGSRGVTRSFNAVAEVAWRATFADRTTAVVVTSVP